MIFKVGMFSGTLIKHHNKRVKKKKTFPTFFKDKVIILHEKMSEFPEIICLTSRGRQAFT